MSTPAGGDDAPSDFNIFKHSIRQQVNQIHSDTRQRLPAMESNGAANEGADFLTDEQVERLMNAANDEVRAGRAWYVLLCPGRCVRSSLCW